MMNLLDDDSAVIVFPVVHTAEMMMLFPDAAGTVEQG
jgi:hypothetical protein